MRTSIGILSIFLCTLIQGMERPRQQYITATSTEEILAARRSGKAILWNLYREPTTVDIHNWS